MQTLNKRELAHVLAALRHVQAENENNPKDEAYFASYPHFDLGNGRRLKPLDADEVDKLCEKLNGPEEPRPEERRPCRKLKPDRIVNLTDRPITEFTPEDTLYVSKTVNGFTTTYLCRFVSFKGGVVKAVTTSGDRDYGRTHVPTVLTARLDKCYLYGADDNARNPIGHRCHWFNPKTKKAE